MAAWRFNGSTTSASWWNRLMPLSPFFAELGLELEGRAMIEGDCQGVSPGRISRLPNAANCERESQISLTRRFPSERNATA